MCIKQKGSNNVKTKLFGKCQKAFFKAASLSLSLSLSLSFSLTFFEVAKSWKIQFEIENVGL